MSKEKDIPFKDLTNQNDETYIDSRPAVSKLVRMAVKDFIESSGGQEDSNFEELADNLAASLIGENKNFKGNERWNTPGGLDVFLKETFGSSETEPKQIVKNAVLNLFEEIIDLFEEVGADRMMEEQWVPAANQILEKYVDLFVGIAPGSSIFFDTEESALPDVKI